jgi:hypothetical protein
LGKCLHVHSPVFSARSCRKRSRLFPSVRRVIIVTGCRVRVVDLRAEEDGDVLWPQVTTPFPGRIGKVESGAMAPSRWMWLLARSKRFSGTAIRACDKHDK